MTTPIQGPPPVPPMPSVGGPSDTAPSGGQGDPAFDKALNQVVGNLMQGGSSMMRDAMQKFFEEEEPDPEDPDSEPL